MTVIIRRLPRPAQPARPPLPIFKPEEEELKIRPCIKCGLPMWSLKAVRRCSYCSMLLSLSGQMGEQDYAAGGPASSPVRRRAGDL